MIGLVKYRLEIVPQEEKNLNDFVSFEALLTLSCFQNSWKQIGNNFKGERKEEGRIILVSAHLEDNNQGLSYCLAKENTFYELRALLKKEKENIPLLPHCHITSIDDNWPQIVTVVYFIFKRQFRACNLSGAGPLRH